MCLDIKGPNTSAKPFQEFRWLGNEKFELVKV
jgi:hypothetical protein